MNNITRKHLNTTGLIPKQYAKFSSSFKGSSSIHERMTDLGLSSKVLERYRADVIPCWTLRLLI